MFQKAFPSFPYFYDTFEGLLPNPCWYDQKNNLDLSSSSILGLLLRLTMYVDLDTQEMKGHKLFIFVSTDRVLTELTQWCDKGVMDVLLRCHKCEDV